MCAPDAEPTIGVELFTPDVEPRRALLDVERIERDEIAVFLQPVDGSDQHAIHLTRAATTILVGMLGRARDREMRHG